MNDYEDRYLELSGGNEEVWEGILDRRKIHRVVWCILPFQCLRWSIVRVGRMV